MIIINKSWKLFLKKILPRSTSYQYNVDNVFQSFIFHIKDGFVIGEFRNFPTLMITEHKKSTFFSMFYDINKDRKKIENFISRFK